MMFPRTRGVAAAMSAVGFTPKSLKSLQFWLDASRISGIANGGAITTWYDRSGKNNDATQATAGKKPLYQASVSGFPAVQFDGSDDYLAISDNSNLDVTTCTIFVVLQTTDVVNTQAVVSKWDTGFSPFRYPYTVQTVVPVGDAVARMIAFDGTNNPSAEGSVVVSGGAPIIVCGARGGGYLYMYVNNALDDSSADTATGTSTNGLDVGIGARPTTPTLPFTGYMFDVLMFNTLLSAYDRSRVFTYLNDKYSVY